MTVAWPAALKPNSFGFYPLDADRSGGAAMTLGEQFVVSPGGRWGASAIITIVSKEHVLAARALRSQLKGRALAVALPNFDGQRLSWPIQEVGGRETGVVLHPGVTRHRELNGTPYEDPAIPAESEIVATVSTTAAIRATSISVAVTQGEAPLAGQQFGIGERLYEIASIDATVGNVFTMTIWPPLRAAAPASTPVLFTRPVCLMRCINFSDAKMLDMLRFATLSLDFVEYI